ncbi:site-specific integrase, partial [Prauserella endophytica]
MHEHRDARSCGTCFAWGVLWHEATCRPCSDFAARHLEVADCGACGRRLPLMKGHCRPCWAQAQLDRPTGPNTMLLPYVRQVRHHQLCFAGMPLQRTARPRTEASEAMPVIATRPAPRGVQLLLFPDLRRAYRYGMVDRRDRQTPANPWLCWALHIAATMAEARGFNPQLTRTLTRNLTMLLTRYVEGELIRYSSYHPVLTGRCSSLAQTTEVLQSMGILLDDRHLAFARWLEAKLADIAPGIRDDTRRWVQLMHIGGPRTRARSHRTLRGYIDLLRPVLLDWSARHDHLREISRDEVMTALKPLHGIRRQITLVALRSLFSWAKRRGVVFANPTSRFHVGDVDRGVLQPLTTVEIARTVRAATTLQARVFVVLAAVHAARPGAIRALHLSDVDLGNRRVTIAGRSQPLSELSHQTLLAWLDHRRQNWPNTANPHLMVNAMTAIGTGQVSHVWANRTLTGLPASLERLRIDRQLDEALVSGADPLHLSEVFDLDAKTAVRYATSARQLLKRPHEDASSSCVRTDRSAP